MSIVSGALCSTLAYFRTKILPHNILNVLNATTIGSLLTDFQAHQPSSFSLDRFSFQKPGWCLLKPPFRQNPKFYFLGRASLMRLIGWVRWVLGNIGPRQHLMTRRGGRASTLQAPSVNEESIAGALFVKWLVYSGNSCLVCGGKEGGGHQPFKPKHPRAIAKKCDLSCN